MSGHSKWNNIKHRKGKADAARSAVFTKIGKEIALAVKEGGSDPEANGRLRDIIAKAKSNNMPNDTIDRSIKKAAGELGNVNYEEIIYEGYAAGGVAVMLNIVTDNRNRTAADVRHIFDKNGGSLGQTGSVSYMFDYRGQLVVERNDKIDEDEFMMSALDAGAEDVITSDEVFEVLTAPGSFSVVREALEKQGFSFVSAERVYIPQTSVELSDEEVILKIRKLLDMLDENGDVVEVFHNAELPEEEEEE